MHALKIPDRSRKKVLQIRSTASITPDRTGFEFKTKEVNSTTGSRSKVKTLNGIPIEYTSTNSITQNTTNSQEKLSDRDYSYESLVSKPDMRVTTLSDNIPNNRADIVFEAKKNAAKLGTRHKDGSVSVYVDDAKSDVVLGKSGLVHSLDRRTEKIAAITVNAGSILKNSIKINELTPKDNNATATYVLIGAAQDNTSLYVIESVVNRYSNELISMDILHSINAKEKSTAALNAPSVSTPNYRTAISISNLLDLVNRYFPDVLPESVLRHYGHTVRPEGKLGESALFSDRDPDATDNRTLLSNALQKAAKTDLERQWISNYQEKIGSMNAEQAKLADLRAQIKELSFAKGPRDTKKESGGRLVTPQDPLSNDSFLTDSKISISNLLAFVNRLYFFLLTKCGWAFIMWYEKYNISYR